MSDNIITVRFKPDLTGRVAVITGAGSELGVALALHAADRGMKVALADPDPRLLAAVYAAVKARGVGTLAECTEQFDLAAIRRLSRRTEQELGPPWLVCNGAGSCIEATLWSVINGVQVFSPDLVTRGTGHIVNIAANELFGSRGPACDIAVSQAIVGLSESLYRELDSMSSPVGVTVVCRTLGDTNITGVSGVQSSLSLLARAPGLRVAPPEQQAARIFAAIARREFFVPAHAPLMRRMSDACVSLRSEPVPVS